MHHVDMRVWVCVCLCVIYSKQILSFKNKKLKFKNLLQKYYKINTIILKRKKNKITNFSKKEKKNEKISEV